MTRRHRAILAGAACTAAFLYLALRQVDFAELGRTVARLRVYDVPGMLALIGLDVLVRALRWRLLLPRHPTLTLGRLYRLEAIGLALNNLLPMRLGEFARTFLASRESGLPFVTVLASIAVERILDALTLLVLLLYLGDVAWLPGGAAGLRWIRLALWGGIAALAGLVALERSRGVRLPGFPAVERLLKQLALGAAGLKDARTSAAVIGLGFLLWFVDGSQFFWGGKALAVEGFTYGLSVTALVAAAAGTALPAVPGYFGAYEFAVGRALASGGVAQSAGVALAGVVHVLQYAGTTAIGLVCMSVEGLTFAGLRRELSKRGEKG